MGISRPIRNWLEEAERRGGVPKKIEKVVGFEEGRNEINLICILPLSGEEAIKENSTIRERYKQIEKEKGSGIKKGQEKQMGKKILVSSRKS